MCSAAVGAVCRRAVRAGRWTVPGPSQVSGFFSAGQETPGGVYGFGVARQID